MTRYAICGPTRHARYVIERLKRQGVETKDIIAVLSLIDDGNNPRTTVTFGAHEGLQVVWTADPHDLIEFHVTEIFALSGRSQTPVHAIFNMFWQNEQAASLVAGSCELIVRIRSDMVLYGVCLEKVQAARAGLASNPIARDSENVSDQFMAFPRDSYSQIWATEDFAETFNANEGIPESMVRHRVQKTLGKSEFTFKRFIDFDIIYETVSWTDSPRVFWLKKTFGWQACYADSGRKGKVTRIVEWLHFCTVGHSEIRHKIANLLLKVIYLPVFVVNIASIRRDLAKFPSFSQQNPEDYNRVRGHNL